MKWPFFKTDSVSAKRAAIQLGARTVHLMISEKGSIVASETLACPDISKLAELIAGLVEKYQLEGVPTTLIIGLADYQMLLVEAPPVEQSELAEALKWKVKDLLTHPVNESIVDGFLLPEDAFRGRQKMAYTVATSRTELQAVVGILEQNDLSVDRVAIPELTLLQLLQCKDQADQTAIILVIGESAGFMMVIADNAMYLSRKLEVTQSMLAEGLAENGGAIEKLVLEVQRSRDYFESQMGKGTISRLLLPTVENNDNALSELLKDRLGLTVEILDAAQLLTIGTEVDQQLSDRFATEDILLAASLSAA